MAAFDILHEASAQTLTPLLAEVIAKSITDLVEQQVAQARREQRKKDAAIVRNFEFNAGHQYDQFDVDEQKEECARRIESDGQ